MQVECIDDTFTEEQIEKIPYRPVKGEIYTIRGREHTARGLGYLLHEIHNPVIVSINMEPNFNAKRFKKVGQEEETGIEIAEEMQAI
jgi:hypothetical protein